METEDLNETRDQKRETVYEFHIRNVISFHILNESETKVEQKNVCFQFSFTHYFRIFSQLHFHRFHRL